MRIWDVPPVELCRIHLLGEHRELHAIWTILTENKSGYRSHPETKRWEGKLAALHARHNLLVAEMQARGYKHASELDIHKVTGSAIQDEFVNTIDEQRAVLRDKHCTCYA